MGTPPWLALKDGRLSSLLPPAEGMVNFQSPEPFSTRTLCWGNNPSPRLRGTLVWKSGESRENLHTGKRVKVLSLSLASPPAQVNFVACQLFALFAAFWFRIYMSPGKTSPDVRHAFVTIFGIYFVIFCFGWWVWASEILIFCNSGVLWPYSWHFPGTEERNVFTPIVE